MGFDGVQRPSAVRINLNGDVPSVPIPLAKRKPSLKQPSGGQRVSLYLPDDSGSKKHIEHSQSSFWSFVQHPKSRASTNGSGTGSNRFSHFADLVFGKQKARSRRRAVTGYGPAADVTLQSQQPFWTCMHTGEC